MMRQVWQTPALVNRKSTHNSSRSWLLGCLFGIVAVFIETTTSWSSEHNWYETIFNRISVERSSARRADRGDNLKTDPVPLRSNEMLKRLDAAIDRYRKITKDGRWPVARKLRFVRRGDDDEALPAIRKQLVAMGDIPTKAAGDNKGSNHFDEWLEYGIKQFQKRHGLRITGRLDRSTRVQLSVSPKKRLRQLTLNRRRIAELLRGQKAKRYVLVNIPGFQLEAVEGDKVVRRHRAIVGKPDRQTPMLKVTIRAVNFFPFWRVPQSIATRDLIPRLKRDPEYLKREHIRVSRGSYNGPELDTKDIDWHKVNASNMRFRQDPGPWNALGLVRIDMPNKDMVYLHDTPLKSLFKQHYRAFSAGCVRVQDVMDLVAWITKNERGISEPGAVKKIVESGEPNKLRKERPKKFDIHLSRPVPVRFVYVTAWAQDNGTVHFRSDIYGKDGVSPTPKVIDTEAPPSASALSP